jgi:hypothetical protein
MGGNDNAVEGEERVVSACRFFGEHIQSCAAQMAGP